MTLTLFSLSVAIFVLSSRLALESIFKCCGWQAMSRKQLAEKGGQEPRLLAMMPLPPFPAVRALCIAASDPNLQSASVVESLPPAMIHSQ